MAAIDDIDKDVAQLLLALEARIAALESAPAPVGGDVWEPVKYVVTLSDGSERSFSKD